MKKFSIILVLILLLCLVGCSPSKENKLTVAVSIPPQVHFIEKICGERVNILNLIPAGASAEAYEMKPKEVISFSNADIYFSIGVPAEKNGILPNLSKNTQLVQLEKTVADFYPDLKIGNERDPHIWLSSKRSIIMVKEIADRLSEKDSENAVFYKENAEKYIKELEKLQNEIMQLFKDKRRKIFYISHPSYGYFADDFGLNMISLENNGQEATPKELADIITKAKNSNIKDIFCQEETSTKQAQAVAKELGGEVKILRPLAKDYETSLRQAANLIFEAQN